MSKKIDISEYTNKITKEEFEKYYLSHTRKDTQEYFNISSGTAFDRIIKYFGIVKTFKEVVAIKNQRIIEKYGSLEEYDKIRGRQISKGISNQTREQKKSSVEKRKNTILEKYGSLDDYYSYHNAKASEAYSKKTKDEKLKSELKKKDTLQKKYGVNAPSQLDSAKDKRVQTITEKYGSTEDFYNSVIEKGMKTKLNKYGDASFNNIDKMKKTCIEKYGVTYPCLTPQARPYQRSKTNSNFAEKLINENISFIPEYSISYYAFDFKVDNILIEINPTPTHNSTWGLYNNPKDKYYHYTKCNIAIENGYRCICIWDWDDENKVIELLKPRKTLYARKCQVKEITLEESIDFINKYHLQGAIKSKISIGLFFNDELVSVMTFGKPRYNKKCEYELLRYCSSHNIIGGANKLFSFFLKTYNPQSIISYCDMSKFSGAVYEDLGFMFVKCSVSRHWYNIKTNKHITDNLLRQRGFDQLLGKEYGYYGKGTSNEELMKKHGFVEIYDCGQSTYIYKNSNKENNIKHGN